MKFLYSFVVFFCLVFVFQVNSVTDVNLLKTNDNAKKKSSYEIKIIKREEWWADESYRYLESEGWKKIIEKRNKSASWSKLDSSILNIALEKKRRMNDYINKFFLAENTITYKENLDGENKLAWPIQKTDYVRAIVVHHTHSEYANSYDGIKDIYRYHSLQREWWDIGYNYIIWSKWEIYEGRAGGDYTVWAHAVWNNRSTVSIAIMWDFDKKPISIMQYKSLKNLVRYLSQKYGINLYDTFSYHKECIGNDCKQDLMTSDEYTLAWHRDAGHTNCPWEVLYKTLQTIREELAPETKKYKPIKRTE